jgi:hypothetical protein
VVADLVAQPFEDRPRAVRELGCLSAVNVVYNSFAGN